MSDDLHNMKERESLIQDVPREVFRAILEAENALSEAIYLADHFAEKNGGNPAGEEFAGSYTMSAGLWNAVLREKQNLRHAIQTTLMPPRTSRGTRTDCKKQDGPCWCGDALGCTC